MRRFEGQVAIVTGAGRAGGIGAAIARRLASEGARVAVVDLCRQRPEVPRERFGEWESLRAVAAAPGEVGEPGLALRAAVTDQADVAATVGAVVEACGRIDVLCDWEGAVEGRGGSSGVERQGGP